MEGERSEQKRYILISDLASETPYSQAYLSLLARRGRIDAKKIGRNWHVSPEGLQEYLIQQGIPVFIPKAFPSKSKLRRPLDPNLVFASIEADTRGAEEPSPIPRPAPMPADAEQTQKIEELPPVPPATPDVLPPLGELGAPQHRVLEDVPLTEIKGEKGEMGPVEEFRVAPEKFFQKKLEAQRKFLEVEADKRARLPDGQGLEQTVEAEQTRITPPIQTPPVAKREERDKGVEGGVEGEKKGPAEATDLEKTLEKFVDVLDKRLSSPRTRVGRTAAALNQLSAATMGRPSRWLMVFLVTIVVIGFVFGGFGFGSASAIIYKAREIIKDATTLQGHTPGTHANEVLLLDKEGKISIYGHIETKGQLRSYVEEGIAPIVVDSTTTVENLSADYLDNVSAEEFTLAFVTKNGSVTTEKVFLEGGVEVGETLLVKSANKLAQAIIEGNLSTLGSISIGKDLVVNGFSTLAGGADIFTRLLVRGDAEITNLVVAQRGQFKEGGLVVSGHTQLNTLGVSGGASINNLGVGDFNAGGDVFLGNSTADELIVNASSTFKGAVNLAEDIFVMGSVRFGDADSDNAEFWGTSLGFNSSATNTIGVSTGLNFDSNTLVLDARANRVGLGTSSPGTLLAVQGTGNIQNDLTVGGILKANNVVTASTTLASGFGTTSPYALLSVEIATSTKLPALVVHDQGTSSPAFAVFPNNFVGLSTSTPGTLFAVQGSANVGSLTVEGPLKISSFTSTSSDNSFIRGALGIGTSSPGAALGVKGAGIFEGFLSADYFTSTSSNNSWLLGQLGIGTTSPGTRLDVAGSGLIKGNFTAEATSSVSSLIATSTLEVRGASGSDLIVQDGRVGIGTSTAGQLLSVAGTGLFQNNLTAQSAFEVQGTATFNAQVWSADITASTGGVDIASAGTRLGVLYADEVNATTLVGTISGGNVSAATLSINSDNATADTEDSNLAFERGTVTPNALLTWHSGNDQLETNAALFISRAIDSADNAGYALDAVGAGRFTTDLDIMGGDINLGTGSATSTLTSASALLGVGSTTPWGVLSVEHIASGDEFLPSFVVADQGTTTPSFIVMNASGRVGVGTSTPGAPFAVGGNSVLGGDLTVTGTLDVQSGVILASASVGPGSTSSPAYSFTTDTDTGITSGGADNMLSLITGGSVRAVVDKNGNVGIGSTSPSALLAVANGDVETPAFYFNQTDTARASNVIGNISANGRTLWEFVYSTIGNLPVGPTMRMTGAESDQGALPQIQFHNHAGTLESPAVVTVDDELGGLIFRGWDGVDAYEDAAQIRAYVDGTPGSNDMPGRLVFFTTPDGSNSLAERMRITNSGVIGINRTSPNTRLDVMGGGSFSVDLDIIGGDINLGTGSATTTITSSGGRLGIASTTPYGLLSVEFDSTVDADNPAFVVADQGTSTPALYVAHNGNVGIGTANPTENLVVAGIIRAEVTGAVGFRLADSVGDDWSLRTSGTNPGYFVIDDALATPRFVIEGANGNVGIGRTSPSTALDVVGAGTFSTDLNVLGGDINLGTGSATSTLTSSGGLLGLASTTPWGLFSIEATTDVNSRNPIFVVGDAGTTTPFLYVSGNNGNVGIGTAGPGAKLEIYSSNSADVTDFEGLRIFNAKDNQSVITSSHIKMGLKNSVGNAYAKIAAVEDTNDDWPGLVFYTEKSVGTPLERMRINSNGAVNIGNQNSPVGIPLTIRQAGVAGADELVLLSLFANNGIVSNSVGDAAVIHMDTYNGATYGVRLKSVTTQGSGEHPRNDFLIDIQSDTPSSAWYTRFTVKNSGNVGIGRTSPDTALDVAGAGTFSTDLNVLGGDINLGTGSATSTLTSASGNLGIGTTTPAKVLQIASTGAAQLMLTDTSAAADLKHWYASSSAGNLTIGSANDRLTSWTERMRIDSSGNVGIGTTTPGTLLSVQGASNIGSLTVEGVLKAGTLMATSSIQNAAGSTSSPAYSFINDTDTGITSGGGDNALSLITGGSVRAYIDKSGNVGIGTASPTEKLTISTGTGSDVRMRILGTEDSILPYLRFERTAGTTNTWTFQNASGSRALNLVSSVGPTFQFDSSGDFQIGNAAVSVPGTFDKAIGVVNTLDTGVSGIALWAQDTSRIPTNPIGAIRFFTGALGAPLEIATIDARITNQSDLNDGNLVFSTIDNGTLSEIMRINSAGNVGIGTTTPGTLLSVQGASNVGALTVEGALKTGSLVATSTTSGFGTTTPYALLSVEIPADTKLPAFVVQDFGTSTPAFAVMPGGNVGIGTANPSVIVEVVKTLTGVSGGANSKALYLNLSSSGNDGGADLFANHIVMAAGYIGAVNTAGVRAENNIASTGTNYGVQGYSLGTGTTNVGGYFTATGATNNYGLIVENGNVGIASTTPRARLGIEGASTTPALLIRAGNTTGDGAIAISVASGDLCDDNGTPAGCALNDIAELFLAEEGIQPGDVVAFGIGLKLTRASTTNALAGVISTAPAIVIEGNRTIALSGFYSAGSGKAPLALSGRVPVKIASTSPAIAAGDFLTVASDAPGLAAKATEAGYTIGKALEAYDPANPPVGGKISMFVNLTYYAGESTQLVSNANDPSTTLGTGANTTHDSMTNNLVTSLTSGLSNLWKVTKTVLASVVNTLYTAANSVLASSTQLAVSSEDADTITYETYNLQSTRGELIASGSATLVMMPESANAIVHARVRFDESFTALIDETEPIKVIVTPTTKLNGGLYVHEKSPYGFEVREINAQDEGGMFDWIVIAKTRGGAVSPELNPNSVSNNPEPISESTTTTTEPTATTTEPALVVEETATTTEPIVSSEEPIATTTEPVITELEPQPTVDQPQAGTTTTEEPAPEPGSETSSPSEPAAEAATGSSTTGEPAPVEEPQPTADQPQAGTATTTP